MNFDQVGSDDTLPGIFALTVEQDWLESGGQNMKTKPSKAWRIRRWCELVNAEEAKP
jgi:hypothetical protein